GKAARPDGRAPGGGPEWSLGDPDCRVVVGDCRDVLAERMAALREKVDLVFADPPFNWKRAYDRWDDNLPEQEYLRFTYDWIDLCVECLRPGGSLWINIPDSWAAEIVCYMKRRLERKPPVVMAHQNWCVWHYRFGQNATERFINSKVHALWFIKPGAAHTWNPQEVLEMSDRASIYADPRTRTKRDGMPAGLRVPLDVWYGKYWGRIQGNNTERRGKHDNQLPEVYLERVILCSSRKGDLVLDPFLGSGTTGVVARALGRRFVGVEYSPENAESAFDRIRRGPARELGRSRGMSTAIFPARSSLIGRSDRAEVESGACDVAPLRAGKRRPKDR
ncbi:MAG TPA: DNA methyltransferase, partial [Phycisphaerales bacterium]|nr:DNA methyltransferase [Phycisphaerales bacterium]